MKGLLCLSFLLFSQCILAQNRLQVHVHGVKHSNGKVSVALYDTSESFLKFDKVYQSASVEAVEGSTRLTFEDLPSGDYALAIFHDENGNDTLDTNWLGIPREPLGFSKARMKTFGPPSFHECAFPIRADALISVDIR